MRVRRAKKKDESESSSGSESDAKPDADDLDALGEVDPYEDADFPAADAKRAGRLRRDIHVFSRRGDICATRKAIYDLYQADDAPFADVALNPEVFLPLVEGTGIAIMAEHELLADEMKMNVKCLRRAFGVSKPMAEKLERVFDSFYDPAHSCAQNESTFKAMMPGTPFERVRFARYIEKLD